MTELTSNYAKSPAKLVYVTVDNVSSIAHNAHTRYFMAKELSSCFGLRHICGLKRSEPFQVKLTKHYYKLRSKKYTVNRSPVILKQYAHQVANSLREVPADVVFSPGTMPIAYLDCKQPIVFWWDTLFAGWLEINKGIVDYSFTTIRDGHAMEQAALDRCELAIFSSAWAAESTQAHYKVNAQKVKVVPFGPNLPSEKSYIQMKEIVDLRPRDEIQLVFVATDWLNKGGEVALEVVKLLNEAGVRTKLTIVGCKPIIAEEYKKYVRVIGFIDASTVAGRKKLESLYEASHFLIVPTKRDTFLVVISEANSFGVPALSTAVGGIPTVIRSGQNGRLFPLEAPASAYASCILEYVHDYKKYKQLAISAFNEYQTRLNWSIAVQTVSNLISDIL